MIERALISPDDILAAARYRLRDWTTEQVADGLEAIHADDGGRGIPEDGRDPFSAACALIALQANAQGDAAMFWRSGYGVIDSYWQAQRARARGRRDGDALDRLIRDYLDEIPGINPKELWNDFKERTEDDHDVLTDTDEKAETISYAPILGAAGIPIKFEAFRKRVQKIRRELRTQPLRSHPMIYADAK